jgi:hypothetical protein
MTQALSDENRALVERGPGYDAGSVVWHCSEEDGGPDVGLQIGLGGGFSLYFGEMPNATLEDHAIETRSPSGWWIVLYGPADTWIIGTVADVYRARDAADEIAALVRPAAREEGRRVPPAPADGGVDLEETQRLRDIAARLEGEALADMALIGAPCGVDDTAIWAAREIREVAQALSAPQDGAG